MTEHDERDRLASLPRERDPGPELRRRVVEALHARGALAASADDGGGVDAESSASAPSGRRWSSGGVPALLRVAAAALVFLAGVAVGGALPNDGLPGEGSGRSGEIAPDAGADTDGSVRPDGALARALQVQRLGSAYVEAIAGVGDAAQGREAAFSAFRGAAEQLAGLPGQDERTRSALLAIRAMEAPADSVAVERWF